MSQRYALVDALGVTQNIVLWDGATPYQPPAGFSLVPEAQAQPYAPLPAHPAVITRTAFWNRFTAAEQGAIATAAETNPGINTWIVTAEAADQIDLADPKTKQGLDVLVGASLITAARETAILAP